MANNDLQVSKNFNEERMKQLYERSNIRNDSKIISFLVNKFQQLILFVDSYNNFDGAKMIIDENIVEIKEDYILFDLLEQNISILKNKIVNKYNNLLKLNNQDTNKYQKEKNKNQMIVNNSSSKERVSINNKSGTPKHSGQYGQSFTLKTSLDDDYTKEKNIPNPYKK